MDERDRRADRGPDESAPGIAGGRGMGDDDREVGALLGVVGRRPEIPREDLDAIVGAARVAWREQVAEVAARRGSRRMGTVARVVGLAAVLVLALGVLWWWSGSRSAGVEVTVAQIEAVSGPVGIRAAGGEVATVARGQSVGPGAEIETGGTGEGPGLLSLLLGGGVTVRADSGTLLRIASAEELELLRGAIYVDTGIDGPAPAEGVHGIEVRTVVGTARDVGTRFAVRLLDPREPVLRLRVRDGAVQVEQRGRSFRAGSGDELVLHQDGTVERRQTSAWGDDWEWVLAAAPAFELEGRTLAELLGWVSRETGWNMRYEDEGLASSAEEITLHGSLGALRPDQAPFAVLPGAGLEGTLDGDTLTVRRAPTP